MMMMTDALSPVPNRRTDNPSASTSSRIDFADFVRQYKMRCSYTHHQMRDLLVLSPLLPHTLYTLSRGNIISYNLLTRKEEVVIAGCDAYCLDVKYGYITASSGYGDTKILDETSKSIIFEGRTPGTSQLNGCTLCKTENDTLLLICKNSGALQVWRLPEMELIQELKGMRNYNKAAISQDGNYMVCAVDHLNSTFLWTFDVQTQRFVAEQEIPLFDTPKVYSSMSCDWDPTSRYFAVAGGDVAVYDILQKEVVVRFKGLRSEFDKERAYDECRLVKFNPNPAMHLMVIAEQSERVHFVNTVTWTEQKEDVSKYGSLVGIAFSDDGKTIYMGTSEGILEWSVMATNSLTEICIRYIRKRRGLWDSLGWDMTILPSDLQEIIPTTSPQDDTPRISHNNNNNNNNTKTNNSPRPRQRHQHIHREPRQTTTIPPIIPDEENAERHDDASSHILFPPPLTIYST